MRTINKELSTLFIISLFTFLSGSPLYADDTEVFLNNNAADTGINPNVLFVVDTSGSMGTTLSIIPDYDPTTTYTGSCDSTRLYWDPAGDEPVCTTKYYIEQAAFKCNTALDTSTTPNTGPMYDIGFYSDIFSRYNDFKASTAYWADLDNNQADQYVECKADHGLYGDGTDAAAPYAADKENGGPWKTTTTSIINWNDSGTAQAYRLYSGNYLNYLDSATANTTKSRLNVVHGVITNLINSTRGINAGLMRFDDKSASLNKGGYIAQHMQEVLANVHGTFNTELSSWDAAGYTPLAETMYEAMLSFKGDPLFFGDDTTPETSIASSRDAADTTQYQSPIDFQCQKNFVIYLTDGEPTYDDSADTQINALTGFTSMTGGCSFNSGDDCLDELAQYMYESDLRGDLNDKQNVITYTIGFGTTATADTLLENTARLGGSTGGQNGVGFFKVSNRNEMSSTFAKIITQIMELNTTFTAPAVSVNAFNRLTHRGELYFALFRPDDQPRWHGNLKRYQLVRSDPTDITSDTVIVDYAGNPAVDQNTGFFIDGSQSWWLDGSGQADGKEVHKGGAAYQLQLDRTVYTYTGATDPVNVVLTSAEHKLHEDNDSSAGGNLTTTLLDLSASTTDAERIALIQWARGLDAFDDDGDTITTTEARNYIGDPLHSKPALMTYKGTTEDDADITLFMATNEGFLHAFDLYNPTPGDPSDDTVNEHFAFMPQELLPNLDTLSSNNTVVPHVYGLDGPVSLWHKDIADADGKKDGLVLNTDGSVQTGEHVYLYMGMRRGGNNYYALDVTDRNAPILKWIIKGGVTTGFEELAQTWSEASHIKIMWDGVEKDVLVFGGGYDTAQDAATNPTDDGVGRAIFIVDAEDGSLLWSAGPDENTSTADLKLTDMVNSIAADIIPVDSDANGIVDRLYTADLGGRIWRIDIDEENTTAANFATGGVLADIGGVNGANNRRFYYAPSVAWNQKGSQSYYSIAVGSGYRAHPLDKNVLDRFYVIRDTNVSGPELDASDNPVYTTITESDLYDATTDIINTGTDDEKTAALDSIANADGWYIDLVNTTDSSLEGEKVLASAATFRGTVMFTTYTPVPDDQAVGCSPNTGTSRFYFVDLYNAAGLVNFDTNDGNDRSAYVPGGSIPAPPTIIYDPDGGGVTVTVGPNVIDFGDEDPFAGRMFSVERWRQTK